MCVLQKIEPIPPLWEHISRYQIYIHVSILPTSIYKL